MSRQQVIGEDRSVLPGISHVFWLDPRYTHHSRRTGCSYVFLYLLSSIHEYAIMPQYIAGRIKLAMKILKKFLVIPSALRTNVSNGIASVVSCKKAIQKAH